MEMGMIVEITVSVGSNSSDKDSDIPTSDDPTSIPMMDNTTIVLPKNNQLATIPINTQYSYCCAILDFKNSTASTRRGPGA